MDLAALLAGAFLLGGIPFAFLFARIVKRVDIRDFGSGNIGATNCARLFPPRLRVAIFLFVFGLDAGKGFLASFALPTLLEGQELAPTLAAAAAVLGHIFTPYLRFRGGKGVATTAGALLGLEPVSTLLAVGVFLALFLATRIVAVGSIGFALTLPPAIFLRGAAHPGAGVLACLLALLIVLRHRSNIAKLLGRTAQ
ncbi:MAG: glycerol-3-phosphate 1-O-acyltransferase PlsY [Planctomycetaceae bacterium]